MKYQWLHVPTGTKGERAKPDNMSELVFLRNLDNWNRLGNGVWIYWTIP